MRQFIHRQEHFCQAPLNAKHTATIAPTLGVTHNLFSGFFNASIQRYIMFILFSCQKPHAQQLPIFCMQDDFHLTRPRHVLQFIKNQTNKVLIQPEAKTACGTLTTFQYHYCVAKHKIAQIVAIAINPDCPLAIFREFGASYAPRRLALSGRGSNGYH